MALIFNLIKELIKLQMFYFLMVLTLEQVQGKEAINGATPNKTLITTNGKRVVEREIEITGGEKGRLDAYFDENNKLQIFAGGSLSAQQILIPDDNSVSGNSSAAIRFGIDEAIGTLSGNEIAVPPTGNPTTKC